jgi:uncharacterized protein YaaW (UPF0174 family)
MGRNILKTVLYTGLLLSLRALFQRQPRWLQIGLVAAAGVILSSAISLKLYGFIGRDIIYAESTFLALCNIVICTALFLLLASLFSYCLYLLLVQKWIRRQGVKGRGGLLSRVKGALGGAEPEEEVYAPPALTNAPIEEILESADEGQLSVLSEILKVRADREAILARLCFLGQPKSKHFIGSILKRDTSPDRIYREMVRRAAGTLRIRYLPYETTAAIEIRISQKVIKTVWERLSPEQKKELEETLRREAEKFDKTAGLLASGSIFASLTAAKLSGLGVYMLASAALGLLQIGAGSLLSTALAGAIGLIIGPAGWIGAGLFTVWRLDRPNYKKIIPAIIFISALRTGYR